MFCGVVQCDSVAGSVAILLAVSEAVLLAGNILAGVLLTQVLYAGDIRRI